MALIAQRLFESELIKYQLIRSKNEPKAEELYEHFYPLLNADPYHETVETLDELPTQQAFWRYPELL